MQVLPSILIDPNKFNILLGDFNVTLINLRDRFFTSTTTANSFIALWNEFPSSLSLVKTTDDITYSPPTWFSTKSRPSTPATCIDHIYATIHHLHKISPARTLLDPLLSDHVPPYSALIPLLPPYLPTNMII
eukprot:TRINITY_DN4475_c0_g1_i2.p1 TRINITY_DN4475_c0_g1~~TRINITY_DN4475_c0_g1_i2.p1  ORF type:complete len:132 (+),score=1.78 TRINITY_DN4475_c0_g1_i2:707-1102(+)